MWSRGWNFPIVAEKHINNYGFLNDQDYTDSVTNPLIAVIGDSYVEAAQIPNHSAFHGLLASQTRGRARVYAFGASGAQLPSYLAYAEFAREFFSPAMMIFVIVSNDYDESLEEYGTGVGLHYFRRLSDGHVELIREDYRTSLPLKIMRESALFRYALLNTSLLPRIEDLFPPSATYVANTSSDTDSARVEDSKLAVRTFIREVEGRAGLEAQRILFVIDGIRPQLYDESSSLIGAGSYARVMNDFFRESAENAGFEVVDLQHWFKREHERHGDRFEFPTDFHWNEHGHRVVARSIGLSKTFARLWHEAEANYQ